MYLIRYHAHPSPQLSWINVSVVAVRKRTQILHNHFTACVKRCSPFICTAVKYSPCQTPSYSGPQIYQLTLNTLLSLRWHFAPQGLHTEYHQGRVHTTSCQVDFIFYRDLWERMTLDVIIYCPSSCNQLDLIPGHFRPISLPNQINLCQPSV